MTWRGRGRDVNGEAIPLALRPDRGPNGETRAHETVATRMICQ